MIEISVTQWYSCSNLGSSKCKSIVQSIITPCLLVCATNLLNIIVLKGRTPRLAPRKAVDQAVSLQTDNISPTLQNTALHLSHTRLISSLQSSNFGWEKDVHMSCPDWRGGSGGSAGGLNINTWTRLSTFFGNLRTSQQILIGDWLHRSLGWEVELLRAQCQAGFNFLPIFLFFSSCKTV